MPHPWTTTLARLQEYRACQPGWQKLIAYLGKTRPDDAPLPLIHILDSNGVDDALWALRTVTGHDREIRLFSIWCARQMAHFSNRSVGADLTVLERYARGEATEEERAAVMIQAWADLDTAEFPDGTVAAWALIGASAKNTLRGACMSAKAIIDGRPESAESVKRRLRMVLAGGVLTCSTT